MATMTSLTFDILLALADEDRHGYGIIKEIEERSGAASAPSTGALYLALQRMEGDETIEKLSPDANQSDARRRYYRLTAKGRTHAEAESVRLAHLVALARGKNLLPTKAS